MFSAISFQFLTNKQYPNRLEEESEIIVEAARGHSKAGKNGLLMLMTCRC